MVVTRGMGNGHMDDCWYIAVVVAGEASLLFPAYADIVVYPLLLMMMAM